MYFSELCQAGCLPPEKSASRRLSIVGIFFFSALCWYFIPLHEAPILLYFLLYCASATVRGEYSEYRLVSFR